MSNDPRHRSPVAGLTGEPLAVALRKSIEQVQANFPPHTGVCVFVFDFNTKPGDFGGMGYISNAQRADMAKALREWLAKEAKTS